MVFFPLSVLDFSFESDASAFTLIPPFLVPDHLRKLFAETPHPLTNVSPIVIVTKKCDILLHVWKENAKKNFWRDSQERGSMVAPKENRLQIGIQGVLFSSLVFILKLRIKLVLRNIFSILWKLFYGCGSLFSPLYSLTYCGFLQAKACHFSQPKCLSWQGKRGRFLLNNLKSPTKVIYFSRGRYGSVVSIK